MDLFKFYPAIKEAYPAANEAVRTSFAAIFIPIRIIYWPYVCSEFWAGAPRSALRAPRAARRAPPTAATDGRRPPRRADSLGELGAEHSKQPVPVVATFLVANILLTGLQFFWGGLIAKGIYKMIKGDAGKSKNP